MTSAVLVDPTTESDHVKRILIGAAAAALGALAFAVPANAAPGDNFWVANDGSTIVGNTTVKLTGNNTSVETTKSFPELTVAKGDTISFKYTLDDGAKCIGGGPRLFVVVDGANVNTWDQNIPDGVNAACNGEAVLPAGKVTAAGVVYDNSVGGTVTVTDVKIGDTAINFKAYEVKTLTEVTAPTATDPTCTTEGVVTLPEQTGVKYTKTEADGKATVKAEAVFGYEIKDGVTTTWTFPIAKKTEGCETPTTPPATPPTDQKITINGEPKVGKVDCKNFEVLYPDTEHVKWDLPGDSIKVNGDTVTFTVNATADKGYVIDGKTTWDLSFKIPANCTATPAPSVSTSPASGDQLPVTGPGGGVNTPLIFGLAGLGLIGFGGAGIAWARRRRDKVEFTA